MNGSNFSVSRLLCSLGNACSSKPQKYTFKLRSTRLTSLLTLYQNKIRKLKHQSNCEEISRLHLAGNWRHAHLTRLLTSEPRFTNKEESMETSNFYQRRPYFRLLPLWWESGTIAEITKLSVVAVKNHEKQKVSNSKFLRLHDVPFGCFVHGVVKILITPHACVRNFTSYLDWQPRLLQAYFEF